MVLAFGGRGAGLVGVGTTGFTSVLLVFTTAGSDNTVGFFGVAGSDSSSCGFSTITGLGDTTASLRWMRVIHFRPIHDFSRS